jgi:uncharacterized protein YlaI
MAKIRLVNLSEILDNLDHSLSPHDYMDDEHWGEYERKPIQVHCSNCHTRHDEQTVEMTGIREGLQGEDIVTFICPDCGETAESKRLG